MGVRMIKLFKLIYQKLSKYKYFITILIIITALAIYFYFKYLFSFIGYPGWGNYILPLNPNDVHPNIFFNYYQYNSIVNVAPETAFLDYILMLVPIIFISNFTSIFFAEKLYVLFSVIFLGLSTYYLSGQLTKKFPIRVIGVLFFLFNPFMIAILSYGDSLILVAESFILISLALLIKTIIGHKKLLSLSWILSIIFLSFSMISYEAFYLGTLLYIIIFIFYYIDNIIEEKTWKPIIFLIIYSLGLGLILSTIFKSIFLNFYETLFLIILIYVISFVFYYFNNITNKKIWKSIIFLVIYLFGSIILLFLLVLPDLYPIFFLGGISHIWVPPLENFIGNSVGPLDNLLLRGYPPNLAWIAVSTLGSLVYNVWIYVEAVFLILLLASPIYMRKLKYLTFSILIIIFSFLGAGPSSILFPITASLYLYIPGFASLNTSYYWDWFIIVPLYFILFISTFSDIPKISKDYKKYTKLKLLKKIKYYAKKLSIPFILALLLFTILLPIVSQGYYNPNGINNTWGETMPNSYLSLDSELKRIVGNSSGGVAFFNPDDFLFFNNTNKWFLNPMINYPVTRTAELQYYTVASTPSTRYFYWVYTLFYQNKTRYLGSLMGLAGIEYFVVLNGTNSFSYNKSFMYFSEGKNATQLMKYQYGVKEILTGNGYAIYKNLNYTGNAIKVTNLTIVSGGYNELSALPYYGFNISNMGIIMSSDLNTTNYKSIMNNVNTIIVPDSNSLYDIILRGIGTPIHLYVYANASSPFKGWASTINLWSAYYGCINPFAITNTSNSLLTVPININKPGNYSIYFQYYHYSNPSANFWPSQKQNIIEVKIGNKNWYFNASSNPYGVTNKFLWEKIQAYLVPGTSIIFKSISGWNELGDAFIIPAGEAEKTLSNFNNTINSGNIKVYQVTSGDILAPYRSPENWYSVWGNFSGNFPNGAFAWLSSLNNRTDGLDIYTPIRNGTLYLKVLHTGNGGLLNITYNKKSMLVGFNPENFSAPPNTTSSYIGIPLTNVNGKITITLKPGGIIFLVGIVIAPSNISLANPIQVSQAVKLKNYYVPYNQNVSNVIANSKIIGNEISLQIKFKYKGPEPSPIIVPLVTFGYNLSFPYNASISASLNITNGFYIYLNSVLLGNTHGNYYYVSSGTYGSVIKKCPYLTIYVLTEKPISNYSINISLTLNIRFYNQQSIYNYSSQSQIINELRLLQASNGYTILNAENITIVRLPYYPLMNTEDKNCARFSTLSGLNQILITNHTSNIYISVSYVKNVMLIVYFDISVIVILIILSFLIQKNKLLFLLWKKVK